LNELPPKILSKKPLSLRKSAWRYYIKARSNPVSAPPAISHVELILNRISSSSETRAIKMVRGSVNETFRTVFGRKDAIKTQRKPSRKRIFLRPLASSARGLVITSF